MKRREMLLATATVSLAGVPGLSSADTDAVAQTDAVQFEDATVDLGGVSLYIGSAAFYYDGGAAVFEGAEWTLSNGTREIHLGGASVTVEDVSAETFAAVRDAMVESFDGRSLSPLLSGLVAAEVDPSAPITVRVGPVSTDQRTLVDEVRASGTVGSATPENWGEFAMGEDVELGAAQFDTATIQRGGVAVTAEEVVAEPSSNALSVASAGGTVEGPGGTLAFENLDAIFRPPAEDTEPHRAALADLRQSAAEGALTLDTIGATLAGSGVTVENTIEAVRNTAYEATVGSITQDGEILVTGFETSGTLAELVQVLSQQAGDGDTAADDEELPKKVIVSHSGPESVDGPEDYVDYVFEVDGELEELEPDEDRAHAVDEVTRTDGTVRVEGSVGTGDDRFAFLGTLTEVDTENVVLRIEDR